MKQRIITAILLMAVALPCVILGGYYFKGLIGVILALSVYEMLHICTRPKIKLYVYPIVFIFFSFENSSAVKKFLYKSSSAIKYL